MRECTSPFRLQQLMRTSQPAEQPCGAAMQSSHQERRKNIDHRCRACWRQCNSDRASLRKTEIGLEGFAASGRHKAGSSRPVLPVRTCRKKGGGTTRRTTANMAELLAALNSRFEQVKVASLERQALVEQIACSLRYRGRPCVSMSTP